MSDPVWRTAEEVAAIFGVKPGTVRMWARRYPDRIHPAPDGRVDLTEVLDWWDNHRNATFVELRTHRRGQPGSTSV